MERTACALAFLLAACGSGADHPSQDSGTDSTVDGGVDAAACTDAPFECCRACDDDTPTQSVCAGGQMQCPGGTVPASSLVCPCFSFACSLPPPHPTCATCDGGVAQSSCNADAGRFECPAGSYDANDLDAAAACD